MPNDLPSWSLSSIWVMLLQKFPCCENHLFSKNIYVIKVFTE